MRAYVNSHPETVQDLELASGDRLLEGLELLANGRTAGGVYLLGYVAEMVLKNACLLLDGAGLAEDAWSRLGTFRTLVEQHFPGIKDENYHSLVFWYHALLAKRIDAGRPLPAPMSVELQRRVVRLYGTWIVKMRYYPSSKFPRTDPEGVYDDVNWIYENRLRMRV